MSIPRPGGHGSRDRIVVPCGKCAACLDRKANSWIFRLKREAETSPSSLFVTLTYNDLSLPLTKEGIPTVNKDDVQRFFKRLRKRRPNDSIRYYLVSEYGENYSRPHYHILLFGLEVPDYNDLVDLLAVTWDLGFIQVGILESGGMAYVVNYMQLKEEGVPEGAARNFVLMSRKPGIGAAYTSKHLDHGKIKLVYTERGGYKTALPRYYAEKLYSKIEREFARKSFEEPEYQFPLSDSFVDNARNHPNTSADTERCLHEQHAQEAYTSARFRRFERMKKHLK